MSTTKVFLASSSELKEDREQFEIFINRKNRDWVNNGVFLDLVIWEDFLDAMSQTRLQDEYNSAIRDCDIFVMLFWTRVGKYTAEEFETAFGQFKTTKRPLIYTYFKQADISVDRTKQKDLMSLFGFQEKLDALGHFQTIYKNIDDLKFKFNEQLDKLAAQGFIELRPGRPTVIESIRAEGTKTIGEDRGMTEAKTPKGQNLQRKGLNPTAYLALLAAFLAALTGLLSQIPPAVDAARKACVAVMLCRKTIDCKDLTTLTARQLQECLNQQ